jgi:hypothetical protein
MSKLAASMGALVCAPVCAIALAACAPVKPKVDAQADPAADYSRFASFAFVEPLAIESAGFSPIYGEAFRRELGAALEQRGLERVAGGEEGPDLLINVASNLTGERDSFRTDPYQALHTSRTGDTFYEGNRGFGQGFGAGTVRSGVGEGSFDVGFVDPERKTMVWEAVASGRMDLKNDRAAIDEQVRMVVGEVMALAPLGRPQVD